MIKECPFCASKNVEHLTKPAVASGSRKQFVYCWDCGARGPQYFEDNKTIQGWNTRAYQQSSPAGLDEDKLRLFISEWCIKEGLSDLPIRKLSKDICARFSPGPAGLDEFLNLYSDDIMFTKSEVKNILTGFATKKSKE